MKVKLVEFNKVKSFSKVEKSVVKDLTKLKEVGVDINFYKTLPKNEYQTFYFGTYDNKPVTISLNTSSPYLRGLREDVYASIEYEGDLYDLGPFSSSSGELVNMVGLYFKDKEEQVQSKQNEEELKQKQYEEKKAEEDKRFVGLRQTQQSILNTDTTDDKPIEEIKETKTPSVDTEAVGRKIESILDNYGVKVNYTEATIGPTVTQYEFKLSPGTKINEVTSLYRELSMGLSVKTVSIGQVEGKSTIGIQVPNEERVNVSLDEVLQASENKGVSVALGKDLAGNPINANILDMQHVLIGGSTGSGKSAGINSMLASLIQSYPPDLVKLVLIDPKKVELTAYSNVPHLLMPIITEPGDADTVLKQLVTEMDNRYRLFSKVGVKNIQGYNNLIDVYNNQHDVKEEYMPYLVVVIDELADLMMTAGKSVESSIQRITQLARAAGIHMIVATQRPSVDVVTGPIKANIASRIAFTTASGVDSRTILDQQGAEKLLGKGDMLFKPTGTSHPKRIQGAFVTDEEVTKIVNDAIEKYE